MKRSTKGYGAQGGGGAGMTIVGPGRAVPPGGTPNAKKKGPKAPFGTFQKKPKDFSKRKS